MKKLVSAEEVKAVAEKGEKTICVQSNTIITPSAKDLAKELGVEIKTGDSTSPSENKQKKPIDRDVVYQIVKMVLANDLLANTPLPSIKEPFLTDCDPNSGLKIVRGRTVKYETFDTGDPNTNVAYREIASNDHAKMSAGFLTIEKSSFDWVLKNEEIDIVLEGSLTITINGKTFDACQGDTLFIPKGAKVTWSSSGYVKLFYVSYPANWADLMVKQ